MKKLIAIVGVGLLSLNGFAQQGADLSGGTDQINTTHNFDMSNGFTVEFNINVNTLQNFNAGITKGIGALAGPLDCYINSNGDLIVWLGDGVSTSNISVSNAITAGQWYHIAIVADLFTAEVFIDGVSAGTFSHPAMANSSNPMIIGDRFDDATNSDAMYDNVRVWSGLRTATEILDNKDRCLSGNEPGLEILYQFESGSYPTVSDLATGNGVQNGSFVNGGSVGSGFSCICVDDQPVTAASANVSCGGSTTIDLGSSQSGVIYYLQNDADNSYVAGPMSGNGSGLSMPTGTIGSTTTYNVRGIDVTTGLDFDGSNEAIVAPDNAALDFTTNMTIELWIYPRSTANQKLVAKSPIGSGFVLGITSGTLYPEIWDNGGTFYGFNGFGNIVSNEWNHVALTWETGGDMIAYINGEEVHRIAASANPMSVNTNTLSIGTSAFGLPFNGKMDDIRLWNTTRTASEIKNNMFSCLSGTEPGLVTYYDLEDGAGSTVATDKSPTGNNATLNGSMDPATDWVDGFANCATCEFTMTQTATVTVDPLTDQTVTAASPVFVCNGATTIDLGSSETGVNYYLRDDANNAIIDGPIAGTGSGISFETGSISSTIDYNILAYSPGTSSDALKFDGVSQIVDCGNSSEFEILGDLTLETWVYVDNFATDWVRLVGKGGLTDRTYGMWLSTTGFIKFQIYGAPNYDLDTPPGVISTGQWHHVAVTRTGSDMNIYVDGVLQANGTYSGVGATTTQPFTIGGELVVHDQLDGRQDEVRVWNVGRTQAEIIADMTNCLNGDEPGLVAYYPIEQGTGASDVLDLVSAKNGSLVNMDPATDWMPGATTCGACVTEMSTIATVTIDPINDETVAAASATVCPNTGTTIDLGSSQNDVFYFLRDDATDAIVAGPIAGSGIGLNMNTGNLAATTDFNVIGTTSLGLDFDGSNDHVVLPNESNFDFTTSMTVEFWMKTTTLDLVDALVTKGDNSWRVHGNGSGTVMFAGNGAFPDINATTPVIDGMWHHVAAVYDGTNAMIYIDGTLEVSTPATGAIANSAFQVALGENLQASNRFFDGQLDDVRIWNIARSQSEINDNMSTCLHGTESGLVAYFKFEDGAGSSTLADLTGNGNDGVLTSMNPSTDWVMGSLSCGCEFEMTTIETVTVQDNAPTVAAAPSNMTMGVDAGQCGAVVNYTAPTFDDDCDGTGLAGTMTAGQASGSLFPVGTTTVTYEYTDGSGQSVSASFDVTINDDENPAITAPGPITVNANNVGCTATGVALGTPTTIDNCGGETFTNDAPATFPNGTTTVTWTVTDAAGNQSTDTQIVTVTTDLAGSITETPADCNGNATGSADLTVSGGTSAYTFLWDDASASTTEDLTGLAAGTYNVDITDANGCTAMASITVTEPAAISIAVDGSTDPTGCGVADGTASVTVTGGTVSGAYTYSWSDGGSYTSSVEDPIDMPAGTIQLTVTDDNGCMETTTVSLSDPNGPTIAVDSASSTLVLACNGDMTGDIQIDVTLNGGATSATYLWDDMSATTTEDLTGVGAGTYSVTVTDDNSCVSSTSVTITEPTALSGSGTSTDELVGMDGTIDLNVTGGTAPYTFSWTGPNGFTSTDEDPTGLEAGTYDVNITDDNGCTTTVQVIVGTQVSVYEQDGLAINLYPNPSNGDFTLVSNVNHGQLIVRDALGREVHVQNLIGNQTDVSLNVNESGIYFVEFRSDNKTQTIRVVVRK